METCNSRISKSRKDINAVPVLIELVENGHQLVLFTMRSDIVNPTGEDNELHLESGNYLTDAVNWFKDMKFHFTEYKLIQLNTLGQQVQRLMLKCILTMPHLAVR